MLLRGEWWIREDGSTEYADAGAGGDWDHESIAFYNALNLSLPGEDMDWPEGLSEEFMCCRIEREEDAAILLANGADPKAVAFFSEKSGTPDARKWAVEELGWVRVVTTDHAATLEFWGLDDAKLRSIQRSNVWGDELEGDERVTLSNWATGWLGETTLDVVLGAQQAAHLIRAASGGEDRGVFSVFGGTREGPPVSREELLRRFQDIAAMVWRWPQNPEHRTWNVRLVLAQDPAAEQAYSKKGVYAALRHTPRPAAWASGRHLVHPSGNGVYQLIVTPELQLLDDDSIEKVLIHEAVHIGYPRHDASFRAVVKECGGVFTGSALEDGYKIRVERKDPGKARYVVAKEFDDEKEAVAWGRAEARSGKYPVGTRWRMVQ